MALHPPTSVIGRIVARLEAEPTRLAAKILTAQGDVAFTREALLAAMDRYAAHLRATGVERGATVIVLADHGPELVLSFLGALALGAVPTIYAPPTIKTPPHHYEATLRALTASSGATHLVTDLASHPSIAGLARALPQLRIVAPPSARCGGERAAAHGRAVAVDASRADEVAFLQYSSGTTGLRKGVALTNRAVLAQLDAYAARLAMREDDVVVSWLPLYHDMGLIACFLLPLACGVPFVMMSPFDWLAQPARLFETIALERGTLAWLPNFAFNLLAARVAPDGVDLSSLRGVINCSEPVRADSVRAFADRFAASGLREDALWTCYAMAETTFAVTQGGCGEPLLIESLDAAAYAGGRADLAWGKRTRRTLVSSGRPLPGTDVRIVDAARRPLAERCVGEIAVRSASSFSGYFGQRELTQSVLDDGWYFTGDIGYLAAGHLFVTGRSKDRIVVAGKNIHPEDVEEIVSSVPGVQPGRVAAFGVGNERLGTEDVVVVAESRVESAAERARLALTVAAAVAARLECTPADVRILASGTLLKSSSGKIARASNRARYVDEWRHGVLP